MGLKTTMSQELAQRRQGWMGHCSARLNRKVVSLMEIFSPKKLNIRTFNSILPYRTGKDEQKSFALRKPLHCLLMVINDDEAKESHRDYLDESIFL